MMEVGKVTTVAPSSGNAEQSIRVAMDERRIGLLNYGGPHNLGAVLTAAQAIQLAQLLMKAAECQTEYAVAAKDLEEQKQRLEAKYKDMISGLGLDNPDLQTNNLKNNLVLQAWSGVGGRTQGPEG